MRCVPERESGAAGNNRVRIKRRVARKVVALDVVPVDGSPQRRHLVQLLGVLSYAAATGVF